MFGACATGTKNHPNRGNRYRSNSVKADSLRNLAENIDKENLTAVFFSITFHDKNLLHRPTVIFPFPIRFLFNNVAFSHIERAQNHILGFRGTDQPEHESVQFT